MIKAIAALVIVAACGLGAAAFFGYVDVSAKTTPKVEKAVDQVKEAGVNTFNESLDKLKVK